MVGGIGRATPKEKMKIAWSASERDEKHYDSLFAAEIMDDSLVKVVVTNADLEEESTSLAEAKKQSTVVIEMDVKHGYAAHHSYLNHSDAGDFVFHGLNEKGEVISED